METLVVFKRGEPVCEYPLMARPLEVGSAPTCDIVVLDDALQPRHALVWAEHGTVMVMTLGTRRARPLACEVHHRLGRSTTLVRLSGRASVQDRDVPRTDRLDQPDPGQAALTLWVGRGADGRRVALNKPVLVVGSGPSADLVLSDRAVSAVHCRFERVPGGCFVRDLGSRNGTFVNGLGVALAQVTHGTTVRVGRTTLRLVGRAPMPSFGGIIARSAVMLALLADVQRIAQLSWPALVLGESGVGKEGIAHALHLAGPRRDGPFVAINAGGMAPTLVESELFGHEKGAFTGAVGARGGVFEQANGGTLFLDEIGELPLELQSRLLRVLESWEIRRLGAERTTRVDVRLVCATHRDLRQAVGEGRFREDLYYRVAQLPLAVPPLRERRDDIEVLAAHFLEEIASQVGPRVMHPEAIARLGMHHWPGNVRELRNVCRQLAAMGTGPIIEAADIDVVFRQHGVTQAPGPDALQAFVEAHGGNLAAAARALGIPRTTLRDRLTRYRPSD